MSGIESAVLRLASSDLDAASASAERDSELSKAKELIKDASVRRKLSNVASIAAKACSTYDSYERVLTVLITALFRETTSGESRDISVIESLADRICFLIVSSSEHYTLLLRSAEAQLVRIKSDTVADAFSNVAPENKKAGEALALSTSKKKRKSAASLSRAEQDVLAKNRARRTAPISTNADGLSEQDALAKNRARRTAPISAPGAHAVSGEDITSLDQRIAAKTNSGLSSLSQEERDAAAKSRARRSTKVEGGSLTPDVVREPSEHDRGSRRTVSSASSELIRLESEALAKNRARRSTSGFSRESSAGSQFTENSDTLAKNRARRSASSELSQLESDVVTKNRVRRSSRAASTQLNNLEADVVAKAGSGRARGKGARTGLNELEGEVLAKSQGLQSNKKHRNLPPSETPGVVFERDGEIIERDEFDDVDWEYDKAENVPPHFNESMDKDAGMMGAEGGAGALLATDRGIVNEPHMVPGQIGGGEGLPDTPVAVLVSADDEEEGALIPSAIECDPESKPKIIHSRRLRWYGALAVLSLALIVTVVTKVLTKDDGSSSGPTPSPTSPGEVAIRNQLQIVVGEEKLADETTPEAKAAHWIINEDPMELTADSPNLIQRYVLAVFYMSTTTETPWLSCNRPEVGQDSECLYKLLTEVFPFIVYEQVEWYRWLSEEHECDWAGLFCDETEVVRAVELWGQEISGPLPTVFKELTYLQSIALQWNNFHGTLPKEWAEMQHLLNIEVHYNWLEGEVPQEWWRTSRWAMQRLNIAANQFSGTLPTEIGELNGLKGFFSYENQMVGTFPTELGNIEFLSFTRMGRNFIEGTLPSELGKLEKMQEMWLHRNKVHGTIPTELALMEDIGDLRLHFNPLTGTIPSELYSLAALSRLDLYDCDLSGTIPTEVAGMRIMKKFRIRANNFFGTIPTEMGLLYELEELWIHRNDFTGTIPTEVCALNTASLSTGLHMVDADCLATTEPDGSFGPPQIVCPKGCCTRCCDGETGICDN